ncbi:MAG: hypothetical protein ABSG23_09340 [Terriglobales bacterium]|jgi:hypothetical protein
MFSKAFGKAFSKTASKKTIAVRHAVLAVVLASAAFSQQTPSQPPLNQPAPAAPSSSAGLEFPVIMRQNVAAGTTPVGTAVRAKLAVATMVNGVVIPQDALLSGEVTESVAKSASGPSRLAIRMDSAQWKNGSAPIALSLAPKVYLTAWYYPVAPLATPDLSSGLPNAANHPKVWDASGAYPGQRNPTAPPFPGSDTGADKNAPLAPGISKHRVLMKNVESTRNGDGAVTLTSKRSNIKLDKQTTYVLAAGDLLPAK